MGEVVNLRTIRKRLRRAEQERAAAANRLRHGQGKAERQETALETARREHVLDGARLEPDKDSKPE